MSALDAWSGLGLVAATVALLAAAAVGPGSTRHARVTREGGSIFLGERLMQLGYGWVDRLADLAVRLGLSAPAVSWASFALGGAAGVAAAGGWLGFAAWGLALSGVGDGLDGAVARRRGTAGARGAVLDSALDRYVEFFFLAGLLYFFAGAPLRQLLVMTALFGGFMVTYSTAKAEALQLTPPRGWMKRAERMVWLAGGSALAAAAPLAGLPRSGPLLAALGAIALFAHVSAIRRLRALARAAEAGP